MKRTTLLFIAAGLGLAAATNAGAQDAAAPIRRDSPTPPAEEATAPVATPAPAPSVTETPPPPAPATPSATPSQPEPTATPAKAESSGNTNSPAAPKASGRAIEETPVRPIEKRPRSPRPSEADDDDEPRTGLPPASKPTFDLSDSGGGYVAATVRNLENRWQAAVAKHDADVVEELLADDFIGTSSTGKIGSKSTLLYELKRDKNTYSSATARGLIVRSFGPNVAVVAGTAKESGTTPDGQRFSNSSRFTDTWVQRSGRWQCVASHITQLPKR